MLVRSRVHVRVRSTLPSSVPYELFAGVVGVYIIRVIICSFQVLLLVGPVNNAMRESVIDSVKMSHERSEARLQFCMVT